MIHMIDSSSLDKYQIIVIHIMLVSGDWWGGRRENGAL